MVNLNQIRMCKVKNVILEIIEGDEGKRTYIVREIQANQPPVTLAVCDNTTELAQFLDQLKID